MSLFHAKSQSKRRRKGKRFFFAPLLTLRLCVKDFEGLNYESQIFS